MNKSPVVQIKKTAGLLKATKLGIVKKSTGLGKVKVMLGLGLVNMTTELGMVNMSAVLEKMKRSPWNWHLPLSFLEDSHLQHIH